jgi:predicted secreted protein
LQQAAVAWDELVNKEAPAEKQRAHLAKIAEILSESSYIRNLERDIEGSEAAL